MLSTWGPDTAHVSQAPDAALGLPGLSIAVFVLVAVSLVVVARRRFRGTPGYRRTTGGAAMSNVLMDFNAAFMANHPTAAVVMKLEEETHEDDAGEGPEAWTPPAPKPATPYRTDDGEWFN